MLTFSQALKACFILLIHRVPGSTLPLPVNCRRFGGFCTPRLSRLRFSSTFNVHSQLVNVGFGPLTKPGQVRSPKVGFNRLLSLLLSIRALSLCTDSRSFDVGFGSLSPQVCLLTYALATCVCSCKCKSIWDLVYA